MHVYFRIQLDPSEIQQTDVSILKKKKTQQENGNKQLTHTIALWVRASTRKKPQEEINQILRAKHQQIQTKSNY